MSRILLLTLIPVILFAQGWKWENPKPLGDPIQQVFFVDSVHGWMVPENTTLLKTTDGKNWNTLYTNVYFDNIYFINKNEGWGVGRKSFEAEINNIYHTKDGGLNWEIQLTDTVGFYNVYFLDKLNGWATDNFAYDRPIFHTTDGGLNWKPEGGGLFRIGDSGQGIGAYILFSDSLKGFAVFFGAR